MGIIFRSVSCNNSSIHKVRTVRQDVNTGYCACWSNFEKLTSCNRDLRERRIAGLMPTLKASALVFRSIASGVKATASEIMKEDIRETQIPRQEEQRRNFRVQPSLTKKWPTHRGQLPRLKNGYRRYRQGIQIYTKQHIMYYNSCYFFNNKINT